MDEAKPAAGTQCDDILILTASTGAGHDSVAVALQEALQVLAPTARVRVLDALSGKHPLGLFSPGRWYDAIVDYAPWLWELLYRATNAECVVRLGIAAGGVRWTRQLRATIQTGRPGIIVSVHPLCTRLAAHVLGTGEDAAPLHCVVTDLVTIHRAWACDAVAAFYVATADARDALIAAGVPGERIHVTGLPLRASFAAPPQATREDAVDRVLLLGGGRPARRIAPAAEALASSRLPLQIIVVCGRNARLRRRLARILPDHVTVLGWRDDIAALMCWSTVVVTKGGPTTIAEAFSQARPVAIFHALKDQETGNVALVEQTGFGRYLPDVEDLVRALAERPPALSRCDGHQARWWATAAQRVAGRLLAALGERPAELAAVGLPLCRDDPESPDRVIRNPISGERIVIRQSAVQTDGKLLSFDLFLPPGSHVPARHIHPNQEERFTVIEGRMRFRLGRGHTILARPGDTVVVPPGTAHWFGNDGDCESHARVEARPALRLQEVFERSATMEVIERLPGARVPRLSELALFLTEFQRELAVPGVPAVCVRAFLAPFAWRGRRRARTNKHGAAA